MGRSVNFKKPKNNKSTLNIKVDLQIPSSKNFNNRKIKDKLYSKNLCKWYSFSMI